MVEEEGEPKKFGKGREDQENKEEELHTIMEHRGRNMQKE
jgi:hypothetical protein